MSIEDFFKKFCKECKEKCDKGLVEKAEFIRCVDRDIFVRKNAEENKK